MKDSEKRSKFVCKMPLLARALGLKAEQPLGQARARRYGLLYTISELILHCIFKCCLSVTI